MREGGSGLEKGLREKIRDLEESHLKLEIRKQPEKLGQILADEFKEIGSSGFMFGKKECLEDGVTLHELSLHHFDIQLLAPEVVLTTYLIHNKTKEENTLRSSIWKRIDGRWQLYFHQGTKTNLTVND